MISRTLAVIMSVYRSDRDVDILKSSIESILNQTFSDFDFMIAIDGYIEKDIKDYLLFIEQKNNHVHLFFDDENHGLAYQLNKLIDIAIQRCDYKYFARMDADDISNECRFEQQIDFLEKNKNIDVVGSDVIEISSDGEEIFYKKMESDHFKMYKKIIKRCPFNHPTVMFRADLFREGFRYNSSLKNTQDYYLWIDLLCRKKKFANINKPLLKFRIDDDFHSRRGLKKAINDVKSRIYALKKLRIYSVGNVVHVFALFFLRVAPPFVKKIAYKIMR